MAEALEDQVVVDPREVSNYHSQIRREVDRALAASAPDAGRITITQQELDDLMARAREAQLELLADLRIIAVAAVHQP